MFKLIKEFLLSAIEANKAITDASKSTAKVNKKAVEYYDTIIYNDNLRTQMLHTPPVSNTPNQVPYSEICSCNPKNGGNGICGCVIGNQMVDKNQLSFKTTTTTSTDTDLK